MSAANYTLLGTITTKHPVRDAKRTAARLTSKGVSCEVEFKLGVAYVVQGELAIRYPHSDTVLP